MHSFSYFIRFTFYLGAWSVKRRSNSRCWPYADRFVSATISPCCWYKTAKSKWTGEKRPQVSEIFLSKNTKKNKSFLKRFRLKSWTYFLAEMAAHLSFMGHVCTSRRILIDSRWSVPTAWTAPRSGSHLICRDHTNISPFFFSPKINSFNFIEKKIELNWIFFQKWGTRWAAISFKFIYSVNDDKLSICSGLIAIHWLTHPIRHRGHK